MSEKVSILIFMLVLSLVLVSSPQSLVVKAEPKTIVVPDDYASIGDAVRNAREGDVIFVKSGTYNETMVIEKRISVIGENAETTVIDGNYSGAVIVVRNNGITISGFTITNGITKSDFHSNFHVGVHLLHVNDCVVASNKFVNGGSAIWLYGSNNNNISNNSISKNNIGIKVQSSTGNKLIQNTVFNCSTGVLLESDGNVLKNNQIFNNNANLKVGSQYNHGWYYNDIDPTNFVNGKPVYYLINEKNLEINPLGFPEIGFLALVNCENITVTDLTLTDRNYGGLIVYNSSNVIVSNNIIVNNYYGLEIQNSFNIKICGNNVSDSGGSAIFLQYSHNVSFLENYVANSWIGLKTWRSQNFTITGNQIANNEHAGIEILGCEKLTIAYNIIKSNELGISHRSSSLHGDLGPTNEVISNNQITDNTFMAFTGWFHNANITNNYICGNNFGLEIGSHCIVTGNNISHNHGIALRLTANNLVTENYIANNELCFNLFGNNSKIYNNNLINNTENLIHAREITSSIWDNGEKGNYWSNYTGTDNDGDKIGDSAFSLDEYNQDDYPLMNPAKISVPKSSFEKNHEFEENRFQVHDTHDFYYVTIVSNSSVSDFDFRYSVMRISFYVNGTAWTTGLCNVSIPSEFMSTQFSVFKDEKPLTKNTDYTQTFNGTHYLFTITYDHSSHLIQIYANNNIPEFPSWTPVMVMVFAGAFLAVVYKRKMHQQNTRRNSY